MNDKEIEEKIEDLKWRHEEYFSDSEHSLTQNQVEHIWNALISKMLIEAYSLGQSHMKQRTVECVPEESLIALTNDDLVAGHKMGWNQCREQILSALNEL